MSALIWKEVKDFAAHPFGLFAMGIILILAYLFLWVFEGSSYLAYGLAETDLYVQLFTYLMIFIVPALAVQYITEDLSKGTVELLRSMSLSWSKIINAKMIACTMILLVILLLSLGHVYATHDLGLNGQVGSSAILVNIVSMLLMGAVFIGVSFWISAMMGQMVPSYITSVIICFFLYQGVELISELSIWSSSQGYALRAFGLKYHIDLISRGILKLSSIVYVLGLLTVSWLGTYWVLSEKEF